MKELMALLGLVGRVVALCDEQSACSCIPFELLGSRRKT